MEIRVCDDRKCVEIWLTKAEQADSGIQARLKPVFSQFTKKGYLNAVFLSGERDLYQQTVDLLKHNR